jgi:hypothetical protein
MKPEFFQPVTNTSTQKNTLKTVFLMLALAIPVLIAPVCVPLLPLILMNVTDLESTSTGEVTTCVLCSVTLVALVTLLVFPPVHKLAVTCKNGMKFVKIPALKVVNAKKVWFWILKVLNASKKNNVTVLKLIINGTLKEKKSTPNPTLAPPVIVLTKKSNALIWDVTPLHAPLQKSTLTWQLDALSHKNVLSNVTKSATPGKSVNYSVNLKVASICA